MVNDAKDKGRGIFIGKSQWDDCGDIFIEKDPVQAVYMKRMITEAGKSQYDLIWPSASKYLLYATNKYEKNNFVDTLFNSVTVEPSANDVNIYIRSCSRNYGLKYDYKIIVSSDAQQWITVNKQQISNEGLYIENRGTANKGVYDSVITISVNPNYNLSSRTASFTIVQYNQDLTVTTTTEQGEIKKTLSPTGKSYSFSVIQKADYIISTNFDNQEIEWYSDSTYKTRVTSYKDDSLKANITNGLTKLYFKLPGVLTMASGNKSAIRYYGTSSEDKKLTSSDFSINSGTGYINTISNVEYLGDGGWTATINWKDNISTSNYDVRNIMHYPSSFTNLGGNGYCTFDLYVGGSSDDRNILITLSMASSASRVVCTQSGGQGEQKLVLTGEDISKLDVNIEGENNKNNLEKTSSIEYRSVLGHYYFTTKCEPETSQKLLFCTDGVMCEYTNGTISSELSQFKYTGTLNINQGVAFKLYYSSDYYKGSTYKISISYLGVTGQKTVSQLENKGNYSLIDSLSNINKCNGYENFDRFQVSFKDKFKDTVTVKGQDNSDKLLPIWISGNTWYFQLLIPTNAGSEEGIFNITDIVTYNVEDDGYTPKSDGENSFISYKEHTATSEDRAQIAFKINSAAADSDSIEDQMVIALLDTSDNVINNDTSVFAVRQGGSNTAGDAKYTTEISPSTISIKNVTDNLTMTAFLDDNGPYSQSKKYYKAYIVCNENKDILEGAEVRTIPKEIVNSSIGTVDNYNNTWIHIQVKGKNVYKGKERELNVSIQYIGDKAGEAKTANIYQEANNNVELTDENVPCESLEMSYLSLTDDSQGTIIGADHTSESGWYAVHITLDPNTEVIKKIANLTIGGDLYIDEGNIVKSYMNLPSLTASKLPISFKYDVTGIPVTRTVTLQIEGIEGSITETWTNIPFTGKIVTRNEYKLDWDADIEYKDESQIGWLKIDDNHNLVSSTSSNKDSRSASLMITPLENAKEITFSGNDKPNSSPFKIDITQSAWYDDNLYTMYISGTYKENYIKMANRIPTTIDIPITSYNVKTSTTVGISLELLDTDEEFADVFAYSIDYTSNIVTNGILLSLTCKNPNYTDSNKTYTIKATQTSYVDGQEPNAITFTVIQCNYKFELNEEEVKMNMALATTTNLDYTSITNENSWQQIEVFGIPSWLLCNVTQYGITLTQIEENNTTSNRSCVLTLKQKDSGISRGLKVVDTCYADSEIGVKDIQLYNSNTKKTFTCNSSINEEYADVFCKFINSTIDEDIVKVDVVQGSITNTKATITVTSTKTLLSTDNYQNNMQYGTLQLYNQITSGKQRMLGTVSVIRNAYKFRNATEDVHGTMTIELSPTKETLYHKYFLESFKNGALTNKITNNISTDKIYMYISEDCMVYAYPLYDNDTSEDITYNYFLKQEESGLVIDVTFIQHHK